MQLEESRSIPRHLGFIVDGNRRWARAKGLPTLEGHRRGLKKISEAIDFYKDSGVEFVSFFIFSVENWQRSPEEVNYLMDMMVSNDLLDKMKKDNLRCLILGSKKRLSQKLIEVCEKMEQETSKMTGMTVCLCFNYGGQEEIAEAVNRIFAKNYLKKEPSSSFQLHTKSHGLDIKSEITPELIRQNLYHPAVPDLDLIVRTSGEERISGFHLWRAAYSEFMFIKKNFPAITKNDFSNILQEFSNRHRRFGK